MYTPAIYLVVAIFLELTSFRVAVAYGKVEIHEEEI